MAEYKCVIEATLPTLNEYIRKCRTHIAAGANFIKDWEDVCSLFIVSHFRNVKITMFPVNIHYKWFEKNKKRDKDNVAAFGHKCIQDALVKCGVLENDGWKYINGFTDEFYIDEKNPRIEFIIEELDETLSETSAV